MPAPRIYRQHSPRAPVEVEPAGIEVSVVEAESTKGVLLATVNDAGNKHGAVIVDWEGLFPLIAALTDCGVRAFGPMPDGLKSPDPIEL